MKARKQPDPREELMDPDEVLRVMLNTPPKPRGVTLPVKRKQRLKPAKRTAK